MQHRTERPTGRSLPLTNGLESVKKTHQVAGVGSGLIPCPPFRQLTPATSSRPGF